MVYIFSKHRKSSNYRPTVNKLESLIKFTVETGLATAITFIAEIVLWFSIPNTFMWTLTYAANP